MCRTAQVSGPAAIPSCSCMSSTCRDSFSWVGLEMMGEKAKQRVTQSPVLVSHVNVYH